MEKFFFERKWVGKTFWKVFGWEGEGKMMMGPGCFLLGLPKSFLPKMWRKLVGENLIANDKNAHVQVSHGHVHCSFYFYFYFSIPVVINVFSLVIVLFFFIYIYYFITKCCLFLLLFNFFFLDFFFSRYVFYFLINFGDCIFLVVCHIFVLIGHHILIGVYMSKFIQIHFFYRSTF